MTGRRIKDMDAALGQRLKALRMARGLNQSDLARAVGLTFQQIQKYENGANRLAVSTLVPLCSVLKISVTDFLNDQVLDPASAPDPVMSFSATPGGPELARIYTGLSRDMRNSILSVGRAMATAGAVNGALKAA